MPQEHSADTDLGLAGLIKAERRLYAGVMRFHDMELIT